MTTSEPRVSLVMPTWRRAGHIGKSIRSLLGQSRGDFELIVMDDGDGTDGTREAVLEAASADDRVRYRRNAERLGMPGNLNAGLRLARGELIGVCHDHDLYQPTFVEAMTDLLRRQPTVTFVHTAISVIDEQDQPVSTPTADWSEVTNGRLWARFMLSSLSCPVCALAFVRRDTYERYGLYDPAYGFWSDVEMWLRLSLRGDVGYVRAPQIRVRQREQGHEASADSLRHLRTIRAIHARYIPRVFAPFERVPRRVLLEARVGLAGVRSGLHQLSATSLRHRIARPRAS